MILGGCLLLLPLFLIASLSARGIFWKILVGRMLL
jgi:hypothetical protein